MHLALFRTKGQLKSSYTLTLREGFSAAIQKCLEPLCSIVWPDWVISFSEEEGCPKGVGIFQETGSVPKSHIP